MTELSRTAVLPNDVRLAGGVGSSEVLLMPRKYSTHLEQP